MYTAASQVVQLVDAGRRGCEMWALRHERALRRTVVAKLQWIKDSVASGGKRWQLDWGQHVDLRRRGQSRPIPWVRKIYGTLALVNRIVVKGL